MGMSGFFVWMSAFREQIVKSVEYPAFLFLLLVLVISILAGINARQRYLRISPSYLWILCGILAVAFAFIYLNPDLNSYILPERLWLDKNHFMISGMALLTSIYTCLAMRKAGHHPFWLYRTQNTAIWIAVLSGLLMLIRFEAIEPIVNVAYTVFDVSVVIGIFLTLFYFIDLTIRKTQI